MLDYNKVINIIKNHNFNKTNLTVSHIIPDNQTYPLCFIDGGNSEIISSPKLSLQAIKIVAIILKENKINKIIIKKELVLIKANNSGYEIEIINKQKFNIVLCKNIHEVGNIIRNALELKMYTQMQGIFNGLIIKDGGFEAFTELERKEINGLNTFCGLSKTSKNKDNSLFNSISGCWYLEKEKYYITKLNSHSSYSFKLELKNLEINRVIQKLISNSKDYIYPGYPYGLMLVDRLARVSNQEILNLKVYLETKLGKDWEKIKFLENSINAHQLLDNLVF